MKTKLLAILALFCFSVSSCYDDGELRSQLSDHESRISALETLCKQMNTNISSLQTIVEALQKNDYITSITPIKEGDDTIGYTINFTKGEAVTIYNGQDGHSPKMSVQKHSDGAYYWILDGEWLLDDAGNKIKAAGTDGIDGITPQLKIEEDYWYISYDNGATWKQLCKAVGEDGDAFFQSVAQDETSVTFTLTDGTSITLPKKSIMEFSIAFDEADDIYCEAGQSIIVTFTITGGQNVSVQCLGENGWSGEVNIVDKTSGTIRITAPDPIKDGKILVFASNGTDEMIMKCFNFHESILTSITDEYIVNEAGETLSICISTNVDYEVVVPEAAKSWIAYVKTKGVRDDVISFIISQNTANERRNSEVDIISKQSMDTLTVRIVQEGFYEIVFEDENAKNACLALYDTNRDGKLTEREASTVANIELLSTSEIVRFNEFRYFTSVKEIPAALFTDAPLEEITLPEGLETISDRAFYGTKIVSINLPSSLQNLSYTALPESIKQIHVSDLQSYCNVHIDGPPFYMGIYIIENGQINSHFSIPHAGRWKFQGCLNMNSVDIYGENAEIDDWAFAECINLKKVKLTNVSYIRQEAFAGSGVESIELPEGLKEIGLGAFSNCRNLKTITIPSTVIGMGGNVFYSCESLIKVEYNCNLSLLSYGEISCCPVLEQIVINGTIDKIDHAFSELPNLKSISLRQQTPPQLGGLGEGLSAQFEIRVPADAVETYKTASGWSQYADSIVGYDETETIIE